MDNIPVKTDKPKRNLLIAIVIISMIAVSLIGIFIIRPSVIGLVTYNNLKKSNQSIEDYGKSVQELESKILTYETNLSSCVSYNDKLFGELKTYTVSINECNNKLTTVQMNYNTLKNGTDDKIFELQEQITLKDESITRIQADYDSLAQNTANNLCCKAKVDNSNINSYKVENNKVVCMEDGEKNISC